MIRKMVLIIGIVAMAFATQGCGSKSGGGMSPSTEKSRIQRIEKKGGHLGARQQEMSEDK